MAGFTSPDGKGRDSCFCSNVERARDGYFTNDDIITHTTSTMDILDKHYPNEEHVLVFDNATTPSQNARKTLSLCSQNAENSRQKPRSQLGSGSQWGRWRWKNLFTTPMGRFSKVRVNMGDTKAKGRNGTVFILGLRVMSELGCSKAWAAILEERGFTDTMKLKAQCKDFKLQEGRKLHACCRRILYNEPDFVNVPFHSRNVSASLAVIMSYFSQSSTVNLNFIEQCWGLCEAPLPTISFIY